MTQGEQNTSTAELYERLARLKETRRVLTEEIVALEEELERRR